MVNDIIYLDNAATTRVSEEVFESMKPYFLDIYGNSNSLHKMGLNANKGVENSRKQIASALNCTLEEVFFTSGGTEANNWAIKGAAKANARKGKHVIISSIEHHSILESAKELQKDGFEISYAPVDENGVVVLDELKKLIRADTILVSIMAVNNEVGSVQPIEEIAFLLKGTKTLFHVDYVQALSVIKPDVQKMGVDLLSISSHKVHGPKGVGALFIKKGTLISKLIDGGEQERGKRGGTTNVPGVVGFGRAVEIAMTNQIKNHAYLQEIKDYFVSQILEKIQFVKVNGDPKNSAPQIANLSFDLVEGESILLKLSQNNICVSTGSACASTSLAKSHVLTAMGMTPQIINGAVRFSFGADITKTDVDFVVKKLVEIVTYLRAMSPLKEKDVCIMKK